MKLAEREQARLIGRGRGEVGVERDGVERGVVGGEKDAVQHVGIVEAAGEIGDDAEVDPAEAGGDGEVGGAEEVEVEAVGGGVLADRPDAFGRADELLVAGVESLAVGGPGVEG